MTESTSIEDEEDETPSLSPLDMIQLSHGTHDATGHCIWLGAKWFLQALTYLEPYLSSSSSSSPQGNRRRLLELGSGTGLSGLAVWKRYSNYKHVVLTDQSPSALELCRLNRVRNQGTDDVLVEALEWGNVLKHEDLFDTILATDVLYDMASWKPLLKTVSDSLSPNGYFLLSHVPRSALPEHFAGTYEEYLIQTATDFILEKEVYPCDVSCEGWESFQESGASLLIFRKG